MRIYKIDVKSYRLGSLKKKYWIRRGGERGKERKVNIVTRLRGVTIFWSCSSISI